LKQQFKTPASEIIAKKTQEALISMKNESKKNKAAIKEAI
jgi:hypothetical protein